MSISSASGRTATVCRRRMNAPARFCFRHALHAVNAGFELQLGEHAPTADRCDDFLVAASFPFAGGENLHLPALGRGEALVHPEQVTGKECCLGPAGSGTDFQDRALLVGGILRQKQDLHLALKRLDPAFDLGQFHLGKIAHLPVRRLVGQHGAQAVGLVDRRLVFSDFLHDRLEFGILRCELHIDISCRSRRHSRLDLAEPAFELAHFLDRKLRHPLLQVSRQSQSSKSDGDVVLFRMAEEQVAH